MNLIPGQAEQNSETEEDRHERLIRQTLQSHREREQRKLSRIVAQERRERELAERRRLMEEHDQANEDHAARQRRLAKEDRERRRLTPIFHVIAESRKAPPAATKRLDLSGGQLHVLCPAGIGDFYWIWQKWASVARTRRVTFHFPGGEMNRAGELCDLVGAKCAYMPNLSTHWVWAQDTMTPIPISAPVNGEREGARTGAWTTAQANRHLEAGHSLTSWYPQLPRERPRIDVAPERGADPFCLAFLCHAGYMQGNLSAPGWGKVLQRIHDEIAPVRIVGMGRDLQFAAQVMQYYQSGREHMFDRPLREVLAAAGAARLFVGVAGGPIIVGSQFCPAVITYPNWLLNMPGTWENTDFPVQSLLMQETQRRLLQMPAHILRSLARR